MACFIASGDVLVPPTTSTSGMMCGGLNGCPTRARSGCLHFDCMTLGVIPDELDAISESAGVGRSEEQPSELLPPSAARSCCCGGVTGGAGVTGSGCLHFDCMTLGVIPDELDAISESAGVA